MTTKWTFKYLIIGSERNIRKMSKSVAMNTECCYEYKSKRWSKSKVKDGQTVSHKKDRQCKLDIFAHSTEGITV